MPFNNSYITNQEKFDRELLMQRFNQPTFVMMYKRASRYLPEIESALKKAGVPDDFKYMAMAESSLRNVSYSSAGAAGLRQFMPDTAKKYGLRVDQYVDERLDFTKATQAAAAYLKDLHTIFGNWTLVAAAYNRGEN
jgi:membrane-bound lytic murein transglycosylase D